MLLFHSQCPRGDVRGAFINSKIRRCAVSYCQYGMQYVAFHYSTGQYVPVLLTDGNIMVLYAHNNRLKAHQRMYWYSDQILDASICLEELVKQIASDNPLMPGYVPGQDDQPDSYGGPGMDQGSPDTDHDDFGHDDIDTTRTGTEHTLRIAGSMWVNNTVSNDLSQQRSKSHISELHDAEFFFFFC